jgi:hypothetical protein
MPEAFLTLYVHGEGASTPNGVTVGVDQDVGSLFLRELEYGEGSHVAVTASNGELLTVSRAKLEMARLTPAELVESIEPAKSAEAAALP